MITDRSFERLPTSLGPGETSVIQLAFSRSGSLLILDDLAARTFAKRINLNIIGTLGVLLEAKLAGKIQAVRPYIERIRKTNFFLRDEVIERVLSLAKEDALF